VSQAKDVPSVNGEKVDNASEEEESEEAVSEEEARPRPPEEPAGAVQKATSEASEPASQVGTHLEDVYGEGGDKERRGGESNQGEETRGDERRG